jgi:leucyl-tRNA synthetase
MVFIRFCYFRQLKINFIMDYLFKEIEAKWQKFWDKNKVYKVSIDHSKPKYYVLDMFPYPSGAGLHVGHPLGYIASDIFSRFMRLNGYNVLHPMGFDAYGLPAEQYAIKTGQHPRITTEKNINRYKEQLNQMGFSFDWEREIKTCDPSYYKWTQWVFIKLFEHWYNHDTNKAEPISKLTYEFEQNGNTIVNAACNDGTPEFSAEKWKGMSQNEQQEILLYYRLAYLADTTVNWCPELGTVLANDEVKEGYSVRGGHPVIQKTMKQWSLRVSAYAERLLEGLNHINWTESLKEIQRNWIGRSEGAEVLFNVKDRNTSLNIFTTRPDTIFGCTFMVLAPESELVEQVTIPSQHQDVQDYIEKVKKRSERERIADTKTITGVFSGGYAVHPFTGEDIPIWISEYVLAGYGTGAIMAVPAHDQRDYDFAKHFDLPIVEVIAGGDISKGAFDSKEADVINSGFITGLKVPDAIEKISKEIENKGLGKRKVNYKLRDAIFSRQRYWGEPFPVYFKDGMPYPLDEEALPLTLPEVDSYLPTDEGEPPLARAKNWQTKEGCPLEVHTMPGFAGSSAYYLRYMDPNNNQALVSKEANSYWKNVDLYVGGTEHATGHLIYSRFWNKFLFDIGLVCEDEPFKKLINQGMIQGKSSFVYRIKNTNTFVSYNLTNEYDVTPIHVDISLVNTHDELDVKKFKKYSPEYKDAEFILEDGKYYCGSAVEKMSKSLLNVVNPDEIVDKYGADTLRLYEMFLGPIEQSKPWDTKGIDGVHRFLKKFWRLFVNRDGALVVTDEEPEKDELKILHKTIKKVKEDIEKFSFNTAISAFMICLNELTNLKCHKRIILEPLNICLAPFAPHITEEIWHQLGHNSSINEAEFPVYDDSFIKEETFKCPVSFNGKVRFQMEFPVDMGKEDIEQAVLTSEMASNYLKEKTPKKVIVVPKKIVNIVV